MNAVPSGSPLTVLSEEEEIFRAAVRSLAEEKVRPLVSKMDAEGKFERSLIDAFFEMGLMGIETPTEFDGSGATFFMAILAIEELSRVDASAGLVVDVQNTLVTNAFRRWGNDDIKQRFLPRLATKCVASYALSEAGSGSDAFALACRATEDGDHYVLEGHKLWITNAGEADIFLVFANVDPSAGYRGITAFVVERDFEGFSVGKKEDKLGIRASSTCELLFEGCRVPRENILGEVGKGYKVAIETLNEGRIGIGAQMVGLARGALEGAIAYSKEREQYGKPISENQGMQFWLAEMAIEVEAARLMVYNAARLKDADLPFLKEAAMAKYYSSQVAERVASRALEVYGGYGFTKEYPAEKFLRDSKIGKIYEGTSFMQLQTIAKMLLAD